MSGSAAAAYGLENRAVYVEPEATFTVPKDAERVHNLKEADIAVLAPRPQLGRKRVLDFLQQSKPISFTGAGAEESLHAFLYGISREEVPAKAHAGEVSAASDLADYTFGTEYLPEMGSSSATIIPVGSTLNISVGRSEANGNKTAKMVDRAIKRQESKGVSIQDEGKTGSCWVDDDTWDCLGQYTDDHPYNPYGKYEITVNCLKANDDDPNNQYISLQVDLLTVPGEAVNDWNSSWENDEIYRLTDYDEDIYELIDVGPETDVGTETTTVSINLSANSLPTAGFKYSYSKPEVSVENSSDDLKGISEHYHTWSKSNTSAAESQMNVVPGNQVKTDESTSELTYYLDEYWRWKNPGWTTDTYKVVGEGTGNGSI